MKNKMYVILSVILILFVALYFLVDYKNKQAINNNENPYGKDSLKQETIDQLDDPLYQNQVTPDQLAKKLDDKEDVTVYLYSPTCIYCQRTTPVLVPLAEEQDIDLLKLNLLEFKEPWNTYHVEGTPLLIHFENGEEVARLDGARSSEEFTAFFDKFVH